MKILKTFTLLSFFAISIYCMDGNEYGQFQNMISDVKEIKNNQSNETNYNIQNYFGCIEKKSYLKSGQENTANISNFLQYRADIRNAAIEYQNCIRNRNYKNQSSGNYTEERHPPKQKQEQSIIFKKTDYAKGNTKSPQIIIEDLHLYNIKKISKFRDTNDKVMIECDNGNFMLPKKILKKAEKLNFTTKLNKTLQNFNINN